jgi:hypothetical protein
MYSLWAKEHRTKYIFWVSIIGFVSLTTYLFINLYEPATCFDGEQNQGESGIDCGGNCELLCRFQTTPTQTVWARSFKVTDALWSAVAYLENTNSFARAKEAKYRFTLFDKGNNIIAEREGSTYITPGTVLPIYEKRISTNGRTPYRTEFEWIEQFDWYRIDSHGRVTFQEQQISDITTKPQLQAMLVNNEPYPQRNIEAVAIIYDSEKNAIATSRTFVDVVDARGKRRVIFSWSSPFITQPERWEIIARIPVQEY